MLYLKSPKLNEILLVLLSIFSYLFYKQRDVWSLLFVCLIIIFLLNKPIYILYAGFILTTMIFVSIWFKQGHLQNINGEYRVNKILSSGIVIQDNNTNIFIRTKIHFRLNDLIQISGKVEVPKNFSTFDYVGYLKTYNIENIIKFPMIKIMGVSNDIRSLSREFLSTGPKEYKEIAPLMLLGQKTLESKVFYGMAVQLSVVHLFVISGFHISLFFIIVTKLLNFIHIQEKISGWISLIFVFVYLFLLNFSISASRAALLTFFVFINKHYLKSKFTSLQLLALVMAGFCIYHPWIIKSLSFIFTFTATATILFFNTFEFDKKWKKNILIAISVYISTLFISININGYLSIFGIMFGVLLTPLFSIIFVVSMFFFPFKQTISYLYFSFEQVLYFCQTINILIYTPWFTKEISKVVYLMSFSCFIIIKIWNSSTGKKIT